MAFVNVLSDELGGNRTIDYERGAVLQKGGGAWYERVPGGYFTITWKGEDIVFSQYTDLQVYNKEGTAGKVTYHIVTCEYPEQLRTYRNEIIEMIREGLDVFGTYYGKEKDVEVVVTIDPSIGNLNPNYNWDTQKIEPSPVNAI